MINCYSKKNPKGGINSLPLQYLILWVGTVGGFPTFYYIFSRKSDYVEGKKVVMGILLKIHLNIRYIPTSIKVLKSADGKRQGIVLCLFLINGLPVYTMNG